MKVKVADLKPNPFRNLEKYQVDRAKVEALKASIQQTEFWDNLLARAVGDAIQLAYGHHRLVALKELGVEEIDITVKDIDDATMLRIMANENMDDWKAAPGVIMETVRAAKAFIEAEMGKYATWEEWQASACRGLINDPASYGRIRSMGVGIETIHTFLGKQWSRYLIENTLSVIRQEEDADRKRAEAYEAAQRAKEEKERRQAAEAVEKVERDRLAAIEAERKAQEAEERKAREAADREERQRRQAEEKARRDEETRIAKLEAEKKAAELAKVEAERRERENVEREAKAKAAAEAKVRDDERKRIEAEQRAAEKSAKEAEVKTRAAREAEERAAKEAAERQAESDKAEADGVDREAFEMFATVRKARMFHAAVKANKIPKAHHKALAEKYRDGNSDEYALIFREFAINSGFIKVEPKLPKELQSFDEAVSKTITKMDDVSKELEREAPFLDNFQLKSVERRFYAAMERLRKVVNTIHQPSESEESNVGKVFVVQEDSRRNPVC